MYDLGKGSSKIYSNFYWISCSRNDTFLRVGKASNMSFNAYVRSLLADLNCAGMSLNRCRAVSATKALWLTGVGLTAGAQGLMNHPADNSLAPSVAFPPRPCRGFRCHQVSCPCRHSCPPEKDRGDGDVNPVKNFKAKDELRNSCRKLQRKMGGTRTEWDERRGDP